MKYILIPIIALLVQVSLLLILKYKFPNAYAKVKAASVYLLSKALIVYNKVKQLNIYIINNIKNNYNNQQYARCIIKLSLYLIFLIIQIILFIFVIISYLACKYFGVCILI